MLRRAGRKVRKSQECDTWGRKVLRGDEWVRKIGAVRARSERVEEPVAAATPTTGMPTRARSDPTEIMAAERECKLSAQKHELQQLSREAQRQQN